MSQHDYNVANAPGATVRADVNALAEAIASMNAGNTAPAVTFPFMWWADTTNSLIKQRNAANNAWVTVYSFSGSTLTLDAGLFKTAASGDWFGTVARVARIETGGAMEIGSSLELHPDAAGTEDYRARLLRATGANGLLTLENTGSGGLNIVPGSGGLKVDGVLIRGKDIGEIFEFGGPTLPAKCLWANGQNVSRTTYTALFAAYGTTYGNGDGTTTFGIPDRRGRVAAGKDDMGGTAANRLTGQTGGVNGLSLGAAGGAETHVLTLAQLAAHFHVSTAAGRPRFGANTDPVGTSFYGSSGDSQSSSTSIMNSSSVGSDQAHNNVQPTLIENIVVYAGV